MNKNRKIISKNINISPMVNNQGINSSEEELEIDLSYILENCPSIKIVRNYLKVNLDNICDPDEDLFNLN